MLPGKHGSLLPTLSEANQTNNKSIYSSKRSDFLPIAVISVVYLHTEMILKAGTSKGLCSEVAADVTELLR